MKPIALALAGAAVAAILGGQAWSADSSFPARNGRIVFARYLGGNVDLYSVRADGYDIRRLTRASEDDGEPAVSPDGRRIAFVSRRHFKTAGADIWLMNANGSSQTRLTTDTSSESAPAWSPDGTRLVFVSDRNRGRNDLYVMNVNGSGLRRLTTTGHLESEPAWSPDGKKIAFARYPSSNNNASRIFVVNADGSDLRMLSSRPYEHSPTWSPDGRRIAFVRTAELYIMRPDGRGVLRMTRNSWLDAGPAWSPDGRKIAFASDRSGAYEIWMMDADGTRSRRLTRNARFSGDTKIDWQPRP